MRVLKWLGGIVVLYVVFVVAFEAGYLGAYQPSFEENGIPMLVLTTLDESGQTEDRMLARFENDGLLYVSAHHWTRGWYERAIKNPSVRITVNGATSDYRAVPVQGEEFKRVASAHPLPLMVRFLMGFPPPREILRLDLIDTQAGRR